jgi:radical SAM protein with 4Fe4S-binding SPASM domain
MTGTAPTIGHEGQRAEGRGPRVSGALRRQLERLPQYRRRAKHLRSLLAHSTWRKLTNLLLVESEWLLRRQVVRGRPYILFVDPTNVCNLRCPLCPTGTGDLGRAAGMLTYECFTEIIDRFAPYAYEVNLYNWGEPLLNKDIFRMIEYAHDRNLMPAMSSNLNTVRASDVENLARSSLEYLTVSLDGTTPDVYAHYRRGGKFESVIENLQRLLELRRSLKRKTPFIEWQFIVMKHNVHQLDEARRLAKAIGVDLLRFIPVGLPFEAKERAKLQQEWYPELGDPSERNAGFQYQFLQTPERSACFYLYRSITVNPDGRVSPCCIVYGEKNDFGHSLTQGVDELWNNEHYQSARALFSKKGTPTVDTICDRCHIFQQRAKPRRRQLELLQTDARAASSHRCSDDS